MQRFTIVTLIDITETKQFRHQGGDSLAKSQQQNFATLIQTIGLRVNPIYQAAPWRSTIDVKGLGFGSKIKGEQDIWTFEFGIEFEGGFTDSQGRPWGLLEQDLHLVPVITGLTETAKISLAIFDTKSDSDRNTIIDFNSINKK